MKKVAVINYGLGNTYSIQNAVSQNNGSSTLLSDPDKLNEFSHVILPGVGGFPHAMQMLQENSMDEALKDYVDTGRPLMGICLGMQLLFAQSDENDLTDGLGLISGKVTRFDSVPGFAIPQIQWNKVAFNQLTPLVEGLDQQFYYFLHSYCVKDVSHDEVSLIGYSNYAEQDYVSFVQKNNIIGAQFHPEKSAEQGLKLINNFMEL
jgi:glutamine amidotransferase